MTGGNASSARLGAGLAGALAVCAGCLVLAGWALDVPTLKSVRPGWVSVKPNTALAFVLMGLALLISTRPPSTLSSRISSLFSRLAVVCSLLAGLIGLLTLCEYTFGWNPGFDQWLFSEAAGTVGTSHPGRMAPDTALCFVLLAAAVWMTRGPRTTPRTVRASAVLGLLATALALAALLFHPAPGLATLEWWELRVMTIPVAAVFAVLGAAIALEAMREALRARPSHFSRLLWAMAGCVAAMAVGFALHARSEQQIRRTNELRYRSHQLADELRQAGDDLTRMARTYVMTGDPVHKQRFFDILDIHDGRKPRPEGYSSPYWDLEQEARSAPRGSQPAIALAELMRQAGFTDEELGKLAEAEALYDVLTNSQLEAMKLVESVGAEAETNRATARMMVYEESYRQAKLDVMGPVHDFLALVDRRTLAAVHAAEHGATALRFVLAALGLGLLAGLWRTSVALSHILGGSVDEVSTRIAEIGSGDFSAAIQVKAGQEYSVLGRLSETRARLDDLDRRRTQTEEALRRSDELSRRIVESSHDCIKVLDLDANLLSMSEGGQRLLAITDITPYLNHSWVDFWQEADRPRVREAVAAARAGNAGRFEAFCAAADGEPRWWEVIVTAIRGASGRPRQLLAISRDVTERNRAEEEIRRLNTELEQRVRARTAELEAANKELEAFSYSVSHDLRTPLRAIDGFGRILAEEYEDRLDQEGRRLLDVISRETRRMGQLIEDLLAFSRLGRQKLEASDIDMTALVQDVFESQAALVPKRSLQLDLKPLPSALGDRAMMRVVLANLLSNAIKFTGPRDPGLIEVGSREEDGHSVYYVKDNGVGFDMEYAPKLFGVFQRLHAMEEFEGTGVGLSLVQRVIHRHGGRVWADARVNEGATVHFSLPESRGAA